MLDFGLLLDFCWLGFWGWRFGVGGRGMELFTLESLTWGYESYWCLEWVGTSIRQAIEKRDILSDKYGDGETFRITVWIDGKENAKFYFRGRNEIREDDL
jgi:hypothetical protein